MNRYRVYGLNLETDLTLAALPATSEVNDLVLHSEAVPEVPQVPGLGRLLSGLAENSPYGQSLTEAGGHYSLRYHSLATFEWHETHSAAVICRFQQDRTAGWASVLAASSFLAAWLAVNGQVPIHAGVVEFRGRAFAFAGHSQQGKTTLSHAACLAGARIISDDVLVTAKIGDRLHACAGSLQLRLREPGAQPPNTIAHRSVDERHCFRFTKASEYAPLAAVIVPNITEHHETPVLERLSGLQAFNQLAQFPRLLGQGMPSYRVACFREYAALIAAVPIYRAHLPRGIQHRPEFPVLIGGWLAGIDSV